MEFPDFNPPPMGISSISQCCLPPFHSLSDPKLLCQRSHHSLFGVCYDHSCYAQQGQAT